MVGEVEVVISWSQILHRIIDIHQIYHFLPNRKSQTTHIIESKSMLTLCSTGQPRYPWKISSRLTTGLLLSLCRAFLSQNDWQLELIRGTSRISLLKEKRNSKQRTTISEHTSLFYRLMKSFQVLALHWVFPSSKLMQWQVHNRAYHYNLECTILTPVRNMIGMSRKFCESSFPRRRRWQRSANVQTMSS